MKELLLVCAVTVIFVFGYCIMKKADVFLEKNRRCIEQDDAKNSLNLAFDNPMIMDSLMPVFEKFSKKNPDCQLHFMFGNTENICDKLNQNSIDFGFINYTDFKNEDTCNSLIISVEQNSIFCENTERLIEPLNSEKLQTAVLWKKDSHNAFVNCFSKLLFQKQAEISVVYKVENTFIL